MTTESSPFIENGLLSFNNCVSVIVGGNGKESETFVAHEQQLTRSPFFAKALKKEWIEGQNGKIELPDDEPLVVRYYLHFLYQENIPRTFYEMLSKLYVFGEKVMDVRFKNAVLRAIVAETKIPDENGSFFFPVAENVNIIYQGTPPGSPGRKLLVDLFYYNSSVPWFENFEYEYDFIYESSIKRAYENDRSGHADAYEDSIRIGRYLEHEGTTDTQEDEAIKDYTLLEQVDERVGGELEEQDEEDEDVETG